MNKLLAVLVFLGWYLLINSLAWGLVLIHNLLLNATKLDIVIFTLLVGTIATLISWAEVTNFCENRHYL
jgi:hypothetical protein